MPAVMGTAGHIDHGKTALVRALTSIDCDRLEEERRRGITIELGFAHLDLEGGERLSIVDVPGHERFIKNMAAGASCIDFVLLVIAADEGVMPQTREHLDICTLLGVDRGLVALTKTDLADPELLSLVREDIADFLEGTFLEGEEMIPVSSKTGEGIDELKAALARQALAAGSAPRSDLLRLPVDRVFTMRGHGTVVTGTLVSGTMHAGEELRLQPRPAMAHKRIKVRGLQSHGQETGEAPPGRRTAVNLQGVAVDEVERGDVLARPGELLPSRAWDVELTLLPSCPRPLRQRSEVHFHHGARELFGRVYFPDRDRLAPGEAGLALVRFSEPLAGVFGDRFIIRSHSPLRTIGGGRVINPLATRRRKGSPDWEQVARMAGEPGERVLAQLMLARHQGLALPGLRVASGLPLSGLEKLLQKLSATGDILRFDRERDIYVHGGVAREMEDTARAFAESFHKANPLKESLGRGELAGAWPADTPPKLAHLLIERLLKAEGLESVGDGLKLAGHTVTLAADQDRFRKELLARYQSAGTTPPNLNPVLEELGVSLAEAKPVIDMLRKEGTLVRVSDALLFSREAMEDIKSLARKFLAANQDMSPQDFKEITGLSRKYLIPLLEHLDREKFTVRVGDKRRLRASTAV